MTEQQLDDLALRAAQHIREQHVADPEGDDAVWEARLGRAIALAIRDALAAHEHRFLHLRGTRGRETGTGRRDDAEGPG